MEARHGAPRETLLDLPGANGALGTVTSAQNTIHTHRKSAGKLGDLAECPA